MLGNKKARAAAAAVFDTDAESKYRHELKQKLALEKRNRDKLTEKIMATVGERRTITVLEVKQLLSEMTNADGTVVVADESD